MKRVQLISQPLLRTVSCAAAAGQLASLVIPALCVAEPLAWFAGFPGASMFVGYVSDALSLALLGLICLLCPWCHEVLVAKRGSPFTRVVSLALGIFGAFLLLDSTFGSMAQTSLLTDRELITIGLSLGISFTVIVNINSIAAAPLWMRICLPLAGLCYIGCAVTIGVIPLLLPYTILKLAAALLLVKPLSLLRRNAPRIGSLPES